MPELSSWNEPRSLSGSSRKREVSPNKRLLVLKCLVLLHTTVTTTTAFQLAVQKSLRTHTNLCPYNDECPRNILSIGTLRSMNTFLSAKANRKGKEGPAGKQRGAPKQKNANNKKKQSNKPSSSSPPKKEPSKTAKKSSTSGNTPPWQVLSDKDAKVNIEKEKVRRQRTREGDHNSIMDDEEGSTKTLSTAFLSEMEQRFLNWKRFNPVSALGGMNFVGAYLDRRLPPSMGVPEVAFLGRSNVGKSSLLNRLSASAGQRDQARVGKTPGATASVNLYALVDTKGKEILGWADLPGFGYAKLSKTQKEEIQAAAENYLGKRRELCLGILLVDIRREPSEDDRAVLAALYDLGVPLVVVATKIDKVSNNQLPLCLETVRDGLGLPEGQPLAISSTTGEGTRDLWRIILGACEDGVRSQKLKYDEETQRLKQEEEEAEANEVGNEYFEDEDDVVYSQGYDWVHGDTLYAEDEFDEEDNEEGQDPWWDQFEESEPEIKPQRETLKSLQQRAREMEKRGEL
eukprot:scaffold768_cov166-Amphora_coffeaeformis.AAC.26